MWKIAKYGVESSIYRSLLAQPLICGRKKDGCYLPKPCSPLKEKARRWEDKRMAQKNLHFVSTFIPDISNILDPHSRKLKAESLQMGLSPIWRSGSCELALGKLTPGIDCKFATKIFYFFTRKNSFQLRWSLRNKPWIN